MQVSAINNSNNTIPSFGHSFRVSICLKNEKGCEDTFVNPYSQSKLYKQLNSKIVEWLNTDYYDNLRNFYGIPRKTSKRKPIGSLERQLIEELRTIDTDYAMFNNVYSVYRRNKLGYITTGGDVAIIENIKGAKQIGIAKSDFLTDDNQVHSAYVKYLTRIIQSNILDYVKNPNVLLRSKGNKEIMLKTVFKEAGKNKKGTPVYELDSFEFHENKSHPSLPPVSKDFSDYKKSQAMQNLIRQTIQHHLSKISGKNVHFNQMERVLNQPSKQQFQQNPVAEKSEPVKSKQIKSQPSKADEVKTESENKKQNKHRQLELDFGI